MSKKEITYNKGRGRNRGFSGPVPETLKEAKAGNMTKKERAMYTPPPGSLMAGLLDLLEGGGIEDKGPWCPHCLRPK